MTLGIALVLIFVLYLIDKHSRWVQTFKAVLWLAVVGATLGCAWASLLLWDAFGPKKQATHPTQTTPQALTSPTHASHPVWIYIDIAEEFDGNFSTRPIVPIQVKDMLDKNEDCVPGSTTFSADKVEWICVQPGEFLSGLPPGAILVPTATNPPKQQ